MTIVGAKSLISGLPFAAPGEAELTLRCLSERMSEAKMSFFMMVPPCLRMPLTAKHLRCFVPKKIRNKVEALMRILPHRLPERCEFSHTWAPFY